MNQTTTSEGVDAAALLGRWGEALHDYLRRLLQRYPAAPRRLMEAIEYSLMAGGKRLRPALLLESCKACSAEATEPSHTALAAAAALELVHTFSLVHDDLPAMDDDDLRRGRPTNHKVYGEAMAILAGDAMVTMAFEILAWDCDPKLIGPLVRELAWATGPAGMIGGQVIDIDGAKPPSNLTELQTLHRMKTGALLTASCRMGAISSGADEPKLLALDGFGRHLGLAFQIVDDMLDQTATAEQLGKATNKDAARGKVTYPVLIGMDASRTEAGRNLAEAIGAIAPLGSRGDGLRALAQFVVERQV